MNWDDLPEGAAIPALVSISKENMGGSRDCTSYRISIIASKKSCRQGRLNSP